MLKVKMYQNPDVEKLTKLVEESKGTVLLCSADQSLWASSQFKKRSICVPFNERRVRKKSSSRISAYRYRRLSQIHLFCHGRLRIIKTHNHPHRNVFPFLWGIFIFCKVCPARTLYDGRMKNGRTAPNASHQS